MTEADKQFSVSPEGEVFPLPGDKEYESEHRRLEGLVKEQRAAGREIVVVMGVGFVGAVMAAVVADSTKKDGTPGKFVIGMQRPSTRSYWKIPCLNRGQAPVKAEDPEVDVLIERCVKEKKTLTATFSYEALTFADVVVVDVQCDYTKEALNDVHKGTVEMAALGGQPGQVIAEKDAAGAAMVLIETTVPPGTTEYVAYPIMKKAFLARGLETEPLLAHSFERVMPGREYVASIRDFWRVCAGVNPESRRRVEKFLSEVLNVAEISTHRAGPAHRERDHQDRGEQLPRHHPGLHGRVEHLSPSATGWTSPR